GRGHTPRLVGVQFGGLAGVDLAEVAPARALAPTDQERGLPVLPALEDIGTAGFLTHCVQPFAPHQGPQLVVLRAHRRPGLEPRGLLLDRDLRVAGLDAEHLAPFGSDGHAITSFSTLGWAAIGSHPTDLGVHLPFVTCGDPTW